ncbi:MAG TPA: oligosaccharide flippase family protein [Conexibacter sp.]|nr:oligosaccharide flippase family protein [Conexibacter sp.]
MTVEEARAPAETERARVRVSGIVAGLTAANVLGAASGFITGPLLARALGASGRGDLAAVVVPLALAPAVLSLGIPAFAYRELPRGRPVEEVVGSLGLPLLLIGLLAAAAAIPVADALAGGRETIRAFLIVGFLSMPLVLVGGLLSSSLAALERWRVVIVMSAIPFGGTFAAIVALYALGELTVATAAGATIGASLIALAPGFRLLVRPRRPVFHLALARRGVSFGVKSWVGGLAQIANLRLDQLLMITAVAPRELGLYAVATTISGASGLATGALSPPLMTRIAGGETHLLPQAVRIVVAATVGLNLALALITPTLLALLFGPQFRDAVPMALVLLAANVPFAGASVLSSGLQADGAPLIPSVGEGIALVITVAGLVMLLGPLGGVGAAIVSLAAYGASFLFQLAMARRRTRVPLSEFLVPSRADVRWARGLLSGVGLRRRAAP